MPHDDRVAVPGTALNRYQAAAVAALASGGVGSERSAALSAGAPRGIRSAATPIEGMAIVQGRAAGFPLAALARSDRSGLMLRAGALGRSRGPVAAWAVGPPASRAETATMTAAAQKATRQSTRLGAVVISPIS